MLGVVAPAQFPIAPLQKCQPKMWWTNVWKRHYWWFKVVLKAIKKKRNKHVTYGLCVMVLHITAPILIFSGPSLALLSPPSCWVPPVQEACNGDSRVAALHVHWLTEPRLNPPPLSSLISLLAVIDSCSCLSQQGTRFTAHVHIAGSWWSPGE